MKIYSVTTGTIVFPFICCLFFFSSCTDNNYKTEENLLSGEYIGETGVGELPNLFAEGLVSTNLSERDVAISPNGKEFYYTLWTGTFGVILKIEEKNGRWGLPEVTSFSRKFSNLEPFITYDGSKLFFSSNRPIEPDGKVKDYDIWYVEKSDSGWGEPINIGAPVNSEADEFYPSIADNGNLYFTAERKDSYGSEDIFMCEYKDRKYMEPVNPGMAINSKTDEFNAFISPDESYIIFSNWGRDDGLGGGDLYISFKNEKSEWKPAINMGNKINSASLDFCPYVSRDGKYFFFTSSRISENLKDATVENYKSLKTLLNNPQNGQNDIYWMSSSFIDSLRIKN